MAFNWDKLCKAQRDYPKPKFALDAISKLLKKRPNDPYVLAWKSSVLLVHDTRAKEALPILTGLCHQQPPITDVLLLSLIYKNILEASRQINSHLLALNSVGGEGLQAWQNTAKVLPNRKARLKLWSDLFVTAMKEDCWEDVRHATVQANKEGINPKSKKAMYYALILANQLAGEKKAYAAKMTGKADPGSQIQLTLALRQMKEAYDNSPKPTDEIIQVASMSDLRFMAVIYQRQKRCAELFELWSHPPPTVKKIIDSHFWDFEQLKIEVAHEQKEWKLVETTCMQLISRIWQSGNSLTDNPTSTGLKAYEVCTQSWTMWRSMLDANTHLYSKSEAKEKIETFSTQVGEMLPPLGNRTFRALSLTQLSLASYLNQPMFDKIKRHYFECHSTPTCFIDLRRFVALLSVKEQKEFQSFISEHARNLGANERQDDASESEIRNRIRRWHNTEETVLKFELLTIASIPEKPDPSLLEDLVGNALRLWSIRLNSEPLGIESSSSCLVVAVEALLHLFSITSCSQYLYQATTLSRYALLLDPQRQCRTTALLSARLHLRLGLGTFAFEHYQYVKVKEMLHDNTAWVLLSRISQAHPYGAAGPKGFSADDELKKVITAIARMEERIDDLLYGNMQQFVYDKALDLLELKRRLHRSLTKHFCTIERRRIARLKGAAMDRSLDLPLKDQEDISDNCDWDAIPGIDHSRLSGSTGYCVTRPITKPWIHNFRTLIDVVAGVTFREIPPGSIPGGSNPFTTINTQEHATKREDYDGNGTYTATEFRLNQSYWKPIAYVLNAIHPTINLTACPKFPSLTNAFDTLLDQLKADGDELHAQCLDLNSHNFESLPFPDEDGLGAIYGRLEVLRVLNRLVDFMRPVSKQRAHPLHNEVDVARCNLLQDNITKLYRLNQTYVQAIIDRLKKNGVLHIKAQISWGKTGAAINELVPDQTLDEFSEEYVDSGMEAMKGILKVKLG